MESLSSRIPSTIHTHLSTFNRSKFVSNQIAQAIHGNQCPICLRNIDDGRRAAVITVCMHAYCIECIRKWTNVKRKCPLCNADFDSWFFRINLSSRTFQKQQLPPRFHEDKKVDSETVYRRQRDRLAERRLIGRSREDLNGVRSQSRPLPRRRSFGWSGAETPDVITGRVLQWRTSIYEGRLQAVPCTSRIPLEQNAAGKNGVKERILQRIEPWIQRELQAILGDPDPSIIVHVATSLFMSSLLEKPKAPPGQSKVEDNYLEPLRPFLREWTNIFWHELRCFAESSFTMETYDTVVQYEMVGSSSEG